MIKHGDIVFIHNEFTWGEPGTYMALFIRGFLNTIDTVEGEPLIYYNHCGNICEENGLLYIYEAGYNKVEKKGQVIKTEWEQWKRERDQGRYIVKRPEFNFDKDLYKNRLAECLGKPYDFNSVILAQPVRALTFKLVWIGRNGQKAYKCFYCSKLAAYVYGMEGWQRIDPEELFYDYDYITIDLCK